jgi:hypothetical protein
MNKSEPILPIRFYDDLFDQQKFSKQCSDFCQLDLVYPANALPNFQFSRAMKLQYPTKFFLRNVCNDLNNDYWKVIGEVDSIFGNGTANSIFGAFPKQGQFNDMGIRYEDVFLDIDCQALIPKPVTLTPSAIMLSSTISFPVLANKYYQFKLIVDKFILSAGSAFTIKIYTGGTGGTLQQTIYSSGVYNYNLLTGPLETNITIEFENFQYGDDFSISYIQAVLNSFYELYPNDVELDETQLKVITMSNAKDIIVYCGDPYAGTYNIPKGEYYFVVNSGLDYYVSEPFKIITLKEIETYYKLTWWNSCDINKLDSILYSESTLACSFRNIIFLDADLFKPEYETIEEGEENGSGDLSVQFQKWRKNLNFEIQKSPEFLTDALSGIFLHDNILIKKPLNVEQEILNNEYSVLKVTNNISQVLDDCFQNVRLKFLLENKYIDTACCTYASIKDCTPCSYTSANCMEGGTYYLLLPPEVGVPGLYACGTGTIVSVLPTDLICKDGKYYTISLIAGTWTVTNIYLVINSVVLVWFWYVISGYIVPNSFAQIEYNKDGAGWVLIDTVQDDGTGAFSYFFPFFIVSGATDFKIRVINITLQCEYGTSAVYDLI